MTRGKVKEFLSEKPGYMKKSYDSLAHMLKSDRRTIKSVIKELKNKTNSSTLFIQTEESLTKASEQETITYTSSDFEEFLEWKKTKNKAAVTKTQSSPKPFIGGDPKNVLVIGDLHCPFTLEGYLEFCRKQQEKFNCGTVIFIGDLVDGCAWSYHEHDVDGMGQSEEILKAKQELKRWYHTFPTAKCTLGNHDLLVVRKAKTHGLSKQFLRSFNEVWEAPSTWEFGYEFIIDNVRYTHGSSGDAIKVAKDSRISTAQGHFHTEAFVEWSVSDKDRIFGLQVGCGIDHKRYAFEYSKPFPRKPIIGCAAVLESGTLPINLLMNL